jgi:hypothetical protein
VDADVREGSADTSVADAPIESDTAPEVDAADGADAADALEDVTDSGNDSSD